MKNHEDLEVWKKSIDLTVDVYRLTKTFPNDEKFGLISQMRRAAVSIASNIAEGAARNGKKEFIQFLSIAAGSASELDTQLHISQRLDFSSDENICDIRTRLNAISRMLQGLIRALKN